MNPKTHERVLYAYCIIAILTVVIIILQGGAWLTGDSLTKVVIGGLLGIPLGGLILIYLLPVRCNDPSCGEKMKPGWIGEALFQWRLVYRCNSCDNICVSNFSFKFGGGSDW